MNPKEYIECMLEFMTIVIGASIGIFTIAFTLGVCIALTYKVGLYIIGM